MTVDDISFSLRSFPNYIRFIAQHRGSRAVKECRIDHCGMETRPQTVEEHELLPDRGIVQRELIHNLGKMLSEVIHNLGVAHAPKLGTQESFGPSL